MNGVNKAKRMSNLTISTSIDNFWKNFCHGDQEELNLFTKHLLTIFIIMGCFFAVIQKE